MPGRLLNGRYALGATPRLGGMATVYKANDMEADNKTVAVKILNRGSGDARVLDKVFEREYGALRRLEHPNIIRLLDGGRDEESEHRFLVFEWLERDLERVLRDRRGTSLGWDDFYDQFGEGILNGLAHAHEMEVAHRDVTPGNVLVTDDGSPRLTDFGIAKLASDFAPGMTLEGWRTEPYAPPGGEYYEFRYTRDVYSFAVVALVALSGLDPTSEHYVGRSAEIIGEALALADAPAEVLGFLERCTSQNPDERPADANVALAELRKIHAERREIAIASGLAGRPLYSLRLSGKVREALRSDFDVQSDEEAGNLLLADLTDEVGFLPWHTETFVDGTPTEGHFGLLGAEFRLHVQLDEDRLRVLRATRDSSSFLDRERERAHRVFADFALTPPRDRAAATRSLSDLRQAIIDRAADQGREEKEQGRRRLFRVWRQTLQALTQVERGREQPLDYTAFRTNTTSVEFILPAPPPDDLVGELRVAPLVDGGLLSGEVIRLTSEGLLLSVEQGDPRQLPARGRLKVDTRMSRSALRRQDIALDVVQRRAGVRPDLEDVLLEPASAGVPTPASEPTWIQPDLDDPKRAAVRAALGAEDVILVEGPPGTGKTTFIAELIAQELARNPDARILVSSQTHAALDNVLERLIELDDSLVLLRLGRPGDERISPRARSLLIGHQLERWRRDVVREGRASLRGWAQSQGLSERDVEIAMRFEEVASVQEALASNEDRRRGMEERLEALRAERRRGGETANETVGAVQDEISAVDVEDGDLEIERTELLDRLSELGAIADANELAGLDVLELRERGEQIVDRDHPAFDGCIARLRLLGDWHGRFGRGPEFEAAALVRAQVVAATCVGFGGVAGWDTIEFDLCIIDEASKANATEILIPLVRGRRWVLVGDHKQLPPYVDEALLDRDLLREFGLSEDEVRETLFERLRTELPEECRIFLSTQHRMVPAIGNLISACFYEGALESAPRDRPGWLRMALAEPVAWLSTSHLPGRREERSSTSRSNPLEVACVSNLLGSLNLLAGCAGSRLNVGVLTGYLEQRDELEWRVAEKRSEWPHLDIECNTVDAFQGRQVDVAIYSVTRSNVGGRLGFLQERRRLNVALSRGRFGLVIVGDDQFAATARGDNPFAQVIRHIHGAAGCCVDEACP